MATYLTPSLQLSLLNHSLTLIDPSYRHFKHTLKNPPKTPYNRSEPKNPTTTQKPQTKPTTARPTHQIRQEQKISSRESSSPIKNPTNPPTTTPPSDTPLKDAFLSAFSAISPNISIPSHISDLLPPSPSDDLFNNFNNNASFNETSSTDVNNEDLFKGQL